MDLSSRFSDGFSVNGDGHAHEAPERPGSLGTQTPPGFPEDATRPRDAEAHAATNETPSEKPKWHDARGRFVKGNPGGPGNPYNRQVAATMRQAAAYMTPERVQEFCDILFARTRKGDMAAAKIFREITMPKGIDPDMVDLNEWKLMQEEAKIIGPPNAPFADLMQVKQTPDPELVLEMMRAVRPAQTATFARYLGGAIAMGPENMKDVREMGPTDGLSVMNEVGGNTKKGKQWLKEQERRAKRRKR